MRSDSVFSSHQFPASLPDLWTAAYIIGHPCGSQGSSHQASIFHELAHLGGPCAHPGNRCYRESQARFPSPSLNCLCPSVRARKPRGAPAQEPGYPGELKEPERERSSRRMETSLPAVEFHSAGGTIKKKKKGETHYCEGKQAHPPQDVTAQ